uniref:Glycosyltransferase 61 catalytic domain-containing protein n=1 Tax=Vannella robusta TaxID=1487602 RepID=A0A7S4IJ30_9EUKA|mmetsp:Transcript_3285/g.4045  ORF Transcript_3285/g.4045 Transcript_3285/m.4045 type:complete len:503 (+) Transcript_3285:1638-3146(+)
MSRLRNKSFAVIVACALVMLFTNVAITYIHKDSKPGAYLGAQLEQKMVEVEFSTPTLPSLDLPRETVKNYYYMDEPTPSATNTPSIQPIEQENQENSVYSFDGFRSRAKLSNVIINEHWEYQNDIFRREITYPPFILKFPNFLHDKDYKVFANWKEVSELANEYQSRREQGDPECQEHEYGASFTNPVYYLTGIVETVPNVTIGCAGLCGAPGCRSSSRCGAEGYCGYLSVNNLWWRNDAPYMGNNYGRVLYFEPPASWAFQHWIPDLFPKLIQTWDFFQDPSVNVLTARPKQDRSPLVGFLWDYWDALDKIEPIPEKGMDVDASEFISGCIAPSIHPFLWKEMRLALGIDETYNNAPLNKVIWIGRDKETARNGRYVVNSDETVAALTEASEAAGYEFVSFNHKKYASIELVKELFGSAKLIIGPHGGGLFNLIFAPDRTSVIELFPESYYGKMGGNIIVWLQSVMIGQDYWRIHSEANGNNVIVDINELLGLLNDHIFAK